LDEVEVTLGLEGEVMRLSESCEWKDKGEGEGVTWVGPSYALADLSCRFMGPGSALPVLS
jgi:hypothetical protein